MLKKEQRETIYRLALQQQHADLADYLDSITVPEGWQVVPVEPTPAMVKAGARCASSNVVWAEMLAAAPKPGDGNE